MSREWLAFRAEAKVAAGNQASESEQEHRKHRNAAEETGVVHRFRAVLTPNRSLSSRGFVGLMGALALINAVVGVGFLALGAWPVFLFCGLDVILVWLAFRVSYRDGRLHETIEIDQSTVRLTRTHPSGTEECFELNSYWTRVDLSEHTSGATELRLTSHGRDIYFARFLSDDERRDLAAVLANELSAARNVGPAL